MGNCFAWGKVWRVFYEGLIDTFQITLSPSLTSIKVLLLLIQACRSNSTPPPPDRHPSQKVIRSTRDQKKSPEAHTMKLYESVIENLFRLAWNELASWALNYRLVKFYRRSPWQWGLRISGAKIKLPCFRKVRNQFFNAFISAGGQSSDRTTRHLQISSRGRREPIPRPRQRCPDRDHSAQVSPQQPYMLIIANLNSN